MRNRGGLTLSPIVQSDHWRVEFSWPNRPSRYFGKFETKQDAEKWISEHRWMTEMRQEPEE